MDNGPNEKSKGKTRIYFVWGLLSLIAPLGYMIFSLVLNNEGDPLRKIRLGSTFYERPGVAEMIRVKDPFVTDLTGFDGQFFFYMGHDLTIRDDAVWRVLDAPQLRARRIGLSVVGFVLGGGPARIHWGIFATQLLAIMLLVLGLQRTAFERGIAPWAILSAATAVPFLTAMEMMTSEMLASALIVWAAISYSKDRFLLCWLLTAFVCLTKEICVIWIFALCAREAIDGRWRRTALWASALAPLVLWIVYLRWQIPVEVDASDSLKNLTWPLAGFVRALLVRAEHIKDGEAAIKELYIVSVMFWFLAGVMWSILWIRHSRSVVSLFAVPGALLTLLLNNGSFGYDDLNDFPRQLCLLPVGMVLIYFLDREIIKPGRISFRRLLESWMIAGGLLGYVWVVYKMM